MVDSMARAAECAWLGDAGRRGPNGDSGKATDPFGPWRSGAARRVQAGVWVVESAIWARMATIVDVDVLLEVVGAAFAAGIGITAIFGLVIYGSTRFDDLRREGNALGAAAFATLAAVGLAAFVGAVVLGLVVMTSK
jgi:hypothetical protein